MGQVLEQTGGSRFSGPVDCFRKTVAESGMWSLYRGLTAPLLGSMAECSSLFVAYGYVSHGSSYPPGGGGGAKPWSPKKRRLKPTGGVGWRGGGRPCA